MTAASNAPSTWPGLTTLQSLAVASQFGVTLAVGVGLGLLAGQWLDGLIHSGMVLSLIGALVGLAAGIVSIVGLYRATLRKSAQEWHAEQQIAATRAAASQRRNV
jgi:ATP synthase protein I